MFLSKKYCFANESEARSGLSDLLSRGSADERLLFENVLSTIFAVRQELVEGVHHRGVDNNIGLGLPDICIPANEDTVIPALSAQGIGCCMEIRQYALNEIPAGLPRVHAYVIITMGTFEWIIDVDADPFYHENIGVIISPEITDLYRLGAPVHRRWINASGSIEKAECYSRESRTYLTCEGIAYVTMRYYFLESDVNQCPIVLSPYVTAYFSYSAGWLGTVRRDWIKLILVAHSQEKQHLLWNLTFDDLSSIELRCAERKIFRLAFLDGTDMLIPLDEYGYPLESGRVQYVKSDAQNQQVVKYTFRSSPTSSVMLPSPFDSNGKFLERHTEEEQQSNSIKCRKMNGILNCFISSRLDERA